MCEGINASTIRKIYEAYDIACKTEDVKTALCEAHPCDRELSEKECTVIAESVARSLEKNDEYFEIYWATVDACINDYLKERRE